MGMAQMVCLLIFHQQSSCIWLAPVRLLFKLGKRLLIPLIMESLQSCQQGLVDVSSPGLSQAMQTGCLPQARTKASRLLNYCTSKAYISRVDQN